jgi:heme/copper-type cytochrome/quinol oxidase subunit 2
MDTSGDRLFTASAAVLCLGISWGSPGRGLEPVPAQDVAPSRREVTVVARRYQFTPVRIEVAQGDLVKVVLRSDDIAHSFTIDAYRIAKRVNGGQSVTFEFRADQPGTFPIFCNLRQDDRCREMRGELVVRPR